MEEEYWLKCGFRNNGELICTRKIADSKPEKKFFYVEDGENKEVKNPFVIKLTNEVIEKINGSPY